MPRLRPSDGTVRGDGTRGRTARGPGARGPGARGPGIGHGGAQRDASDAADGPSDDARWLARAFADAVVRHASMLNIICVVVPDGDSAMAFFDSQRRSAGRLRRLAEAVSLAQSDGHVCLPLAGTGDDGGAIAVAAAPGASDASDAPDAPDAGSAADPGAGSAERPFLPLSGAELESWRTDVFTTGAVGRTIGDARRVPLILDAQHRLYLARAFDAEHRLARRIRQMGDDTIGGITGAPVATVRAWLDRLFGAPASDGTPDWQRVAAALALRQPFTVISGGPGTGKTTTIVRLLAVLLAMQPHARIALAAPTGKAAARMSESIRTALDPVCAQLADEALSAVLRQRLPSRGQTLHALLGFRPGGGGPRHHAAEPLPFDVVVVDEASMIDLEMATRLFEAVASGCRLILLGDRAQLAAVEAGSVFAELATPPAWSDAARQWLDDVCGTTLPATPPHAAAGTLDRVVWLVHSRRFAADSPIGRLAAQVGLGHADEALATLAGSEPDTLQAPMLHAGTNAATQHTGTLAEAELTLLRVCHDGYRCRLMQAATSGIAPREALAAFAVERVLCANRRGPRGVEAINAWFTRLWLRTSGERADRDGWYHGRPFMVRSNEPSLGLHNGDVGIALRSADGVLQAWFDGGPDGARPLHAHRLVDVEDAWAMTVHKSQGSEFDRIVLVLPDAPNRVTTRELVYTAITRARRSVAVLASAAVLRQAIAQRTVRHSGLQARLREVDGGGA